MRYNLVSIHIIAAAEDVLDIRSTDAERAFMLDNLVSTNCGTGVEIPRVTGSRWITTD